MKRMQVNKLQPKWNEIAGYTLSHNIYTSCLLFQFCPDCPQSKLVLLRPWQSQMMSDIFMAMSLFSPIQAGALQLQTPHIKAVFVIILSEWRFWLKLKRRQLKKGRYQLDLVPNAETFIISTFKNVPAAVTWGLTLHVMLTEYWGQ